MSRLPAAELKSFARVAAHLLVDPPVRATGSRGQRGRPGVGLEYFDHRYYEPSDRGHEAVVAERLKHQRGDHGSDAGAPPAPGPEGERRGHGDETGDAATRAE